VIVGDSRASYGSGLLQNYVLPEEHGDADMCHVTTDGLPRLGHDEHLAFCQRNLDGVLDGVLVVSLMVSLSSVRLRRRPSSPVIVH